MYIVLPENISDNIYITWLYGLTVTYIYIYKTQYFDRVLFDILIIKNHPLLYHFPQRMNVV